MKMQSLKYVYRVSLFFLSLIVTGCYSMTTEDQSQEEIMTPVKLGGPWFVEYIEDRPVIDRSPANIVFGEDGQVSGSASCNRFTGSYEVMANTLKIGPLATTRRACIDALGEQEQRFLAAISQVSQWKMENGLLLLLDEAGQQLFRAATHSAASSADAVKSAIE
jgi:putative lipoprotein